MKYTTDNLQIALTTALADALNARGFAVKWHATQDVQPQTAGLAGPLDTVTLIPEFPANPTYIVRLKSDGASAETVIVPALSLRINGSPTRQSIMGLGHKDYYWQRHVRIDGFAADEFQQHLLLDLLHDWLNSEERKEFPVYDYSTNPTSPTLLNNVWVEVAAADHDNLIHEVEAVRYYVTATAVIGYIE